MHTGGSSWAPFAYPLCLVLGIRIPLPTVEAAEDYTRLQCPPSPCLEEGDGERELECKEPAVGVQLLQFSQTVF